MAASACANYNQRCPICGAEVLQSGKGRPKDYCSQTCKRYASLVSWMEDIVTEGLPQTKEMGDRVRSDMFRLSNLANYMRGK